MPIVPAVTGNPYPTVNEIMNTARARVNDMMNDTSGDLLSNDSPASQTYLTDAWKWYQARCDTAGVQTFIKTIPIFGIPARSVNDVAYEAWITWAACSDGVNQYEGPVLPQDMISPKSIWRRRAMGPSDLAINVNGSAFFLMTQATDGLPPFFDCNSYDWRDDGLYFYADSYSQDLKLRYSAYRPPLDITKPDSLVPMMMCEDCLGSRVAFEYAHARGASEAAAMEAWAETAFNTTGTRAGRIKARQSIRRQGYTRRDGAGYRFPTISNQ